MSAICPRSTTNQRLAISAPLAALALVTVAGPAAALPPEKGLGQLSVEHWRVKDGLPGDSILALAQASDGRLWVATLGGVAHFDGIRFTRDPSAGTDRQAPLDVRRLLPGPDGSMWGASAHLAPRRFTADGAPGPAPLPGWPAGQAMLAWAEDARGEIWVATAGGLVRLSGGKVLGPPHPWLAADGARVSVKPTHLRIDRGGTAWLGGEAGLHTIEGGRLRRHPLVPAGAAVSALHEDRRGGLWVATGDGPDARLYVFDGKRGRSFGAADGLPPGAVAALADDQDGGLWIGARAGLTRLAGDRFQRFDTEHGLPERDVTALLVDREGSLWVGTRNGGLSQFTGRTLDTVGLPDEARQVEVTSVCEDEAGALWFGLRGGGAVRSGADGRRWRYGRAEGLPSDEVWAVLPGSQELGGSPGDVWIGTGAGLRRWRAGRIHDPGVWNRAAVALYRDRQGALWIGGNGELGRLTADGRLTRYDAADGLPPRQVRHLAEDPQGRLWVAGVGIPSLVHREGERFVRPAVLHKRRIGPVRSMWSDRSGAFWLSADRSGLIRLRGQEVTVLDARRAFDAEMLYQLLEDEAGDFWMGTNKGLVRLARASLEAAAEGDRPAPEVLSFDTSDDRSGVVASAIRQPSAWKTRSGRLWFATARGAVSVDPRRVRTNLVRPPVRIEALLVDGRPLPLGADLTLGPRPRRLEVHYAAHSLLDPRRVQYRHRLHGDGLDRGWVDAGAGRVAVYTDLPAGSYRFQVQAANGDGLWNEAGAGLRFGVAPALYRRPWFYAICALALAPLGFGIYRLRVGRLRAQYAGMLSERTRVARELHDTILQSMSGIGLQLHAVREHLARAPVEAQQELAELQQTVVDCLEETRRTVWDLRSRGDRDGRRPGDLGPALARFARRQFQGSAVTCEVKVEGRPRHLPHAVENELFRIAQEGLRNASAHARASRVAVQLSYGADNVALTIRDDGQGFAAAEANDSAPARGHFGLKGLAERAQQIGARVDLRSAPGQGTTLEVVVASGGA